MNASAHMNVIVMRVYMYINCKSCGNFVLSQSLATQKFSIQF